MLRTTGRISPLNVAAPREREVVIMFVRKMKSFAGGRDSDYVVCDVESSDDNALQYFVYTTEVRFFSLSCVFHFGTKYREGGALWKQRIYDNVLPTTWLYGSPLVTCSIHLRIRCATVFDFLFLFLCLSLSLYYQCTRIQPKKKPEYIKLCFTIPTQLAACSFTHKNAVQTVMFARIGNEHERGRDDEQMVDSRKGIWFEIYTPALIISLISTAVPFFCMCPSFCQREIRNNSFVALSCCLSVQVVYDPAFRLVGTAAARGKCIFIFVVGFVEFVDKWLEIEATAGRRFRCCCLLWGIRRKKKRNRPPCDRTLEWARSSD